ncbi:MAG: hypothetical protein AAF645_01365 [Myxococcota bacterium]
MHRPRPPIRLRPALGPRVALAAAVVAAFAMAYAFRQPALALLRGEIDLRGEPRFEAAHPPHTEEVDFRDAVGQRWPAWTIARGRAMRAETRATRRRAEEAAHRAFVELRYSHGADRNLVALLDELALRLETPLEEARRIDYLLWAYNHYLDEADVPWRLEATMRVDDPPLLYTRSYEVLSDHDTPSGRLRLLQRADLTNVDEGFLGHTDRDAAMVMMDRTVHFAVHRIWPMLSAGLDARLPPSLRTLAPFVRDAAALALPADERALLEETAVDELALIEVAASIHARAECGNTFRIYGLPWNGLSPPDQEALIGALERGRGGDCPQVTLDEAARLIGASERLGELPQLAPAVETLATWVAGSVGVHELRHARDRREGRRACIGCPGARVGQLGVAVRDEIGAYIASFADPARAYVALAQACGVDADAAGSLAPHAQALAAVLPDLLPEGCEGPIPEDLPARAARLEARYFGDFTPIELPVDFPQRLQLLNRQDARVARHP